MSAERPADCRTCRHFFITYEAEFPYGCRAFQMKSPRLPSVDVRRESGQECRAHEPKGEGTRPGGRPK